VKAVRRTLVRAIALGLGCSAAAALTALPSASGTPVRAHSAARQAPARAASTPAKPIELGAGIDLYTYKGQNFAKASVAELAYLKNLHANTVIVSFPFYISGRKGNEVFSKIATPTTAELAVFCKLAKTAGLRVELRPLMDQTSIDESRASWKPTEPKTWFASYLKWLKPYAAMAQQVGVPEFFVGAEFSLFGWDSYWNGLDAGVRKVYKGTLAYANNGGGVKAGTDLGGKGVTITEDAYPDMVVPNNATVARLTGTWEAFDRRQPKGTVLSEVGIAGVPGAFRKPWEHRWPHPKIDPTVQTRWFTSSCQAAVATHMGGIIFWAIGFGKDELNTPLSAKNQAAWEVGPGEEAVQACFEKYGSPTTLSR
jgi:hypothetical protein